MSKTAGIKCPHCDAPIDYDGSSRYVTCEYCGSNVEVTGENEFVFHKIDEAEVQKTKTEREVKLKELDVKNATDERESEHQKRYRIIWGVIVAVCLIAGFLVDDDMFFLAIIAAAIGFFGKNIKGMFEKVNNLDEKRKKERQDKIDAGYIAFPESLVFSVFKTVKVQSAVEMLENAGFTNVHAVNLKDLRERSEKNKKDIVEKVLVDGKIIYGEEFFLPNANIQVEYHDFTDEYYNNPVRIAMTAASAKIRSKSK